MSTSRSEAVKKAWLSRKRSSATPRPYAPTRGINAMGLKDFMAATKARNAKIYAKRKARVAEDAAEKVAAAEKAMIARGGVPWGSRYGRSW